jgi:STE24 endopeptidase
MDIWFALIVGVIIGNYLFSVGISLLNLAALGRTPPPAVSDIYDDEEYQRSQHYTRQSTICSVAETTCSVVILLIFIGVGGFSLLQKLSTSVSDSIYLHALLFIGLLLLASTLISLPFGWFRTFVLETRYGFNLTTVTTFIMDKIKAALVVTIIGIPLLIGVIWLFTSFGGLGWFYCWLAMIGFTVFMQYLVPTVIMPLFNTFTPLANEELTQLLQGYARRQNFRIQGIYAMDGSKRSTRLNAFFAGIGRAKKIVLFDTLLEKLTNKQILAVLAHEMGHYKKHHIWKLGAVAILQSGFMLYLFSLIVAIPGPFAALGMTPSIAGGMVIFTMLYSPISIVADLISNALSRRFEFEADKFSATTTDDRNALIEGLKILSRENLSNLTPHPAMVYSHYSHPPVDARICALNELPVDGK